MPIYTFRKNGIEWNETLSYTEFKQYLKDNPDTEHVILPLQSIRSHGKKPDDSFRDLLREMKKKHGKRGGYINSF